MEPPVVRERSGVRSGLRRLRKPANSHRNMYRREFSGTSVELRSVKRTKWYNAKKKGQPYKSDKGLKNQLTHVVGTIFSQIAKHDKYAQMSVSKGMKRHGEKALEALLSEFGQIHGHDTFLPQMVDTLTPKQNKEALQLITMIK